MPTTTIKSVIEWANRSQWLIEPQQERSKKSLVKVIDAAVTLFCEKGYDATSIAEISRIAKVSVGAIYTRFSDKRAILQTVIGSYYRTRKIQYDAIIDKVDARSLTARESLQVYLDVMFSGFDSDHALISFVERQRLDDPMIAEEAERLLRHVEEGFEKLLMPHAQSLSIENIKHTACSLNCIVYNTLALQSLHYPRNSAQSYQDYISPIQKELYNISHMYLGIPPA